ncbi:MAG: hypothetical protein ACXAB4_05280 [Candidatus Hodarchaeales archaeon]|jgi:hypothetical protein
MSTAKTPIIIASFLSIVFCASMLMLVNMVPRACLAETQPGKDQPKDLNNRTETFFSSEAQDLTGPKPSSKSTPKRLPGAVPDFRAATLDKPPPSKAIKSSLFRKSLSEWIGRLQPNQGGIIWLSLLATIIVAFDFKKIVSWRNADLILLLALSFLFIDIIRFSTGLERGAKFTLSGIVFLGVFLVTALLLIRALIRGLTSDKLLWKPNVPASVLAGLLFLLLVCNTFLALSRYPDDCGKFTNIGTARLIQTGKFPYGDPKLRGGAAATYGPVLYVAQIPFQLGISAIESLSAPNSGSPLYYTFEPDHPQYVRPPILATKLTLLLFHFIGIAGLIMIGRQLAGLSVGLGLACLYAGSAYVQGIGGERVFITGMTFISHIAPAALTILAFAALNRPYWAGSLLALAAGALFYPVFFFPLWLGYFFWQRKNWQKFAVAFLIGCLIIFIVVLLMTHHSEGQSALRAIYESTVGHQEAKNAYGASTFSFWGTHPKLAAFWQKPFIEGWYLLKPSFLIFAIFIGSTFFMARYRTVPQLAFLTAAVAICIQLWKTHAGGTYVEWYYPFFLIGLLASSSSPPFDKEPPKTPEMAT